MSINASKDLIDLIDSRITAKKYQRVAVVESVSEDNKTAIVRFPETDTTFEFYNKTGEVLAEKDSVYIASNDGDLMNGYIQNRFGESSWLKVGKELEIDPGTIGEDELADGAVTGDKIADFSVTNAHIVNASIDNAKIKRASIDTAKIRDATITTAKIQDAAITNAKIENLAVDNAKIGIAAIDTANIKDLAVKRASIDLEAVGTSQIADGSITDAKIVSLTAEKIVTGTIDTSKVTVLGTNGKLRIANNRLQVFDNQTVPIERVSLGDVNGDGTIYGFRVRGADGTTTLIDETGVKAEGITDGSISNAKISGTAEIEGTKLLDNSIPGGKIVINSITAREISAKTITANEIVANTITAGEIAAGAITADEIAANAVTASKIKAGEITTDHIAANVGETLDISANSAIANLDGRLDSTELKIAPNAIIATVTSSSAYTTDLADKASIADLSYLDSRIDSAGLDITALSAGLSATQTSVDGKVSKASIIASINASGESGVKISADKIAISGGVTFSEAQTLANTAQTNATNSAAIYAANARTNAVSDVNTKLKSKQTTTFIHGGNISTGTITCDSISGGTLNFANINATGQLVVSSTYKASGLTMYTGNKYGQIFSNSTRGITILSSSGGIYLSTNDGSTIELSGNAAVYGGLTVTGSVTGSNIPANIPATRPEAAHKVTELAVFYNSGGGYYYLNVSCNGTNRQIKFD